MASGIESFVVHDVLDLPDSLCHTVADRGYGSVKCNQTPPVDSNFKTLLTNEGPYVSITTHPTLSV